MPEQEKTKIEFKAITPGLGFHPFSDGLPYAPVSQAHKSQQPVAPTRRDLSQGSGAIAAGQATFVLPRKPAPRVSVPVAAPVQQPMVSTATPVLKGVPEQHFGFLYVAKRITAFLIDTVLNVALAATGLSFALLNQDMSPELLMNPGVILGSIFFFGLFNWAIIAAQEVAVGASVGKRICGLTLEGKASTLFLRALLFLPSAGFCGAGLLWALFDSRRRCWHDMVVDHQPMEVARF